MTFVLTLRIYSPSRLIKAKETEANSPIPQNSAGPSTLYPRQPKTRQAIPPSTDKIPTVTPNPIMNRTGNFVYCVKLSIAASYRVWKLLCVLPARRFCCVYGTSTRL